MELFLQQLSTLLEANSVIGKDAEALENLTQLEDSMKTDLVIPFSPHFSPQTIEVIFSKIFSLAPLQTPIFQDELHRFLNHIVSLMMSFCPSTLLMILTNISQTEDQIQQNGVIAVWISKLINILQLNDPFSIQLCTSLIPYCPENYLVDISDDFWVLLREKLTEEELADLVQKILHPKIAKQIVILCMKYPEKIIQAIIEKGSLKFISAFLKYLPNDIVFDTIILNARIGDAINLDNFEELMYSFQVLPYLISRLSESRDSQELTALKPIWKGIIKKLKNEDSYRSFFIDTLMHGASQGLIELDEILSFIDFENEKSPIVNCAYIRLIFTHLQNETIIEKMFPFFRRILTERIDEPYSLLIKSADKYFDDLKDINEDEFHSVIRMFFCPLSRNSNILILLIQFLVNHGDMIGQINTKKFIDHILSSSMSDEMLPYFIKLLKYTKTQISLNQLNWFGNNSHINFTLFPNIDAQFVFELLSSHLVNINHISDALSIILNSRNSQILDLCVRTAFHHLKQCIEIIGFDIEKEIKDNKLIIPKNVNENVDTWLELDEIKGLFQKIQTIFEVSDFGIFLSAILNFIFECRVSVEMTQDEKVLFIIISRFLGSLLPVSAAKLFVSLIMDFNIQLSSTSENLINAVKNNEKLFFDLYFPHNHFDSIVDASVTLYGENETISRFPELVKHAITYSYHIASLFSNLIDQPYPKVKTFLAFSNQEKHKKWIEECRKTIPFKDWIVDINDASKIGEIENVDMDSLDDYHKDLLQIPHDQDILQDDDDEEDLTFTLYPVEIQSAIQANEAEPATMANLISFLWHSTQNIPISKLTSIEKFVFKNLNNSKLVLGFLTYSSRFPDFKLDIDRWVNSYEADSNDELSLYAASLVINSMKQIENLPDFIDEWKPFIFKVLALIGCYSIEYLATNFYKTTGINHLLIRSAINIFSDELQETAPLQIAEICNDQSLIISAVLKIITGRTFREMYSEVISSISSVFFTGPSICNYFLPTNYKHNIRLLSFGDSIQNQRAALVPEGFLTSLLQVLDQEIIVTYEFFTLLLNFALNTNQYIRICKLMDEKCPCTPDHLRILAIDEMTEFYLCKPPSFLRGLFRTSLSKFTLTDFKPFIEKATIISGIDKIYPTLCYANSHKVNMKPWDKATYQALLEIGYNDLKTIMSAFTEMHTSPLKIFSALCNKTDAEIESSHAWPLAQDARTDFSKILIQITFEEASPTSFAKQAIDLLLSKIPLETVFNIVFDNKIIFQSLKADPISNVNIKLLNMAIVIKNILKMANSTQKTDILEQYEEIKQKHLQSDESNKAIKDLFNISNTEIISNLLHSK